MPEFPRFIPKKIPNGTCGFPNSLPCPFIYLRGCVNSSESFCSICVKFVVKK